MKKEQWKAENCNGCALVGSVLRDGKPYCVVTGSPLENVRDCLSKGPFVRIPKDLKGAQEFIETTGRSLGQAGVRLVLLPSSKAS